MSFDWDSIKVINNPDLKEIEAVFTPNSALSGTPSDPTEGVGPPLDPGTDDGGGGGGGGYVDCQKPANWVDCPTQDCNAFDDYLENQSDESVFSMPSYDSSFFTTSGQYPGFALVSTNGLDMPIQTVTNSLVLISEGSTGGPCAPSAVYGHKIGTTNASSIQYIPDVVRPDLNTQLLNGQSKTWSHAISFYLWGRASDGTSVTYVAPNNKFSVGQIGLTLEQDSNTGLVGNSISANLYNNNSTNVGTAQLYDQEVEIPYDLTGVYSLSWDLEAFVRADGTTGLTVNVTFAGPDFELTQTVEGLSTWKADTYATISRPDRKAYPRYFGSTAQPSFCPKVIYIGDLDSGDIEEFTLAAERSIQGYTPPTDCVEWVRPAGCPDCSPPSSCVPSCDAHLSAVEGGAVAGGLAITGKWHDGSGWSIPVVSNPNNTQSTFYANITGTEPSVMPAGALKFVNNIDPNYTRGNTLLATTSNLVNSTSNLDSLPCKPAGAVTFSALQKSQNYIAPQYDISAFGFATSGVQDKANWDQHTGTSSGTYAFEVSVYVDFDSNTTSTATLARFRRNWFPTFYNKVGVGAQTLNMKSPVLDITYNKTARIDYEDGQGYQPIASNLVTGWYTVRAEGTWRITDHPESPNAPGQPSAIHQVLTGSTTTTIISPVGTFTVSDSTDNFASTAWVDAAAYGGVPIAPINSTLPGMNLYGQGSAALQLGLAPSANSPEVDFFNLSLKKPVISEACANFVPPEGCPQVICPPDDCPCYCQGFTDDPLECFPGVISGGIYPLDDDYPTPDDQGIIPNYDGSTGRTPFYGTGQPWDRQLASNFMLGFKLREEDTDRYFGYGTSTTGYGPYQFAFVNPNENAADQPVSGWRGNHEFAALVGYVDAFTNNSGKLVIPSVFGNTPQSGGRLTFSQRAKIENDAHNVGIEALNWNVAMTREGASDVTYTEIVDGASVKKIVTLPSSILDPNSLTCWFSGKVRTKVDSIGCAAEVTVNGSGPIGTGPYWEARWVYSWYTEADLYVNGFLIAEGVRLSLNGDYFTNETQSYSVVVGASGCTPPAADVYRFRGHQPDGNGDYFTNETMPSIWFQLPNSSNERIVGLFLDNGPGAANLPNTEFGKNLQRIDPNYGPDDCDC